MSFIRCYDVFENFPRAECLRYLYVFPLFRFLNVLGRYAPFFLADYFQFIMTIEQLRQSVCEANLALVSYGLVTLTWGNAGQLTDEGDAFVIKPSGVPYNQMKPSDMVLVDLAGNVREGGNRPSSDTPTYVELFRFFLQYNANHPDSAVVRGIVHTHSACATAWAQARRKIPCLGTTHADHFYGPVPLTRPLTEFEVNENYERNTGIVIVERFKKGNLSPHEVPAVLAAGHAPFTWGATAMDAVKNAVALESVAQMARDALLINPQSPSLEPYVLEKHYNRKHGPKAYYGQRNVKRET